MSLLIMQENILIQFINISFKKININLLYDFFKKILKIIFSLTNS